MVDQRKSSSDTRSSPGANNAKYGINKIMAHVLCNMYRSPVDIANGAMHACPGTHVRVSFELGGVLKMHTLTVKIETRLRKVSTAMSSAYSW